MKYGELTLGQIEALFNRLGGLDLIRRILRDEVEVKVVPRYKCLSYVGIIKVENYGDVYIFDAKPGASYEVIARELPDGHIFPMVDAGGIPLLHPLLEAQAMGGSGALILDGNPNLFYAKNGSHPSYEIWIYFDPEKQELSHIPRRTSTLSGCWHNGARIISATQPPDQLN